MLSKEGASALELRSERLSLRARDGDVQGVVLDPIILPERVHLMRRGVEDALHALHHEHDARFGQAKIACDDCTVVNLHALVPGCYLIVDILCELLESVFVISKSLASCGHLAPKREITDWGQWLRSKLYCESLQACTRPPVEVSHDELDRR